VISRDEINKRLKARREGKSDKKDSKGYLICDRCNGYYELQKGVNLRMSLLTNVLVVES
jgi:hypothetical protein